MDRASRIRRALGIYPDPGGAADAGRWIDRALFALVLVGSAVLVWNGGLDPYGLPKATVVLVLTVVLLMALAVRVALTGRLTVPPRAALIVAGLFTFGLVVATAVSDSPVRSVLGVPQRWTGLAMYLAYATLFLLVGAVFEADSTVIVVHALVLSGGIVALNGLITFKSLGGVMYATLGNQDFVSGYLGIVIPLGVWGVLNPRFPPWLKLAYAVSSAVCIDALRRAVAVQGVVAAVAGVLVVAVACLLLRSDRPRRIGLATTGAVAGLGAILLAVGATRHGVLVRAFHRGSFDLRKNYWAAALRMFRDSPVVGKGLDRYAAYFRIYEPKGWGLKYSVGFTNNAAHSVPLQMLATGGVVLGLGYLAFVAVVAVSLVRGLVRGEHSRRYLAGGLGAAWVAYIVQASVSIDVVPLAVVGWVLGGSVVLLGWTDDVRQVSVLGASRVGPRRRQAESVRPAGLAVAACAGVLGLVGTWMVTRPMRADRIRASAIRAAQRKDLNAALARSKSAVDVFSIDPDAWADRARYLSAESRQTDSLTAIGHAARDDPRDLVYNLGAGRVAELAHRQDLADRYYDRVLRIAPVAPDVFAQIARFKLITGRPAEAVGIAQEALNEISSAGSLPLDPSVLGAVPRLWDTVGAGREKLGDKRAALDAYRAALKANRNDTEAKEGITRLGS